MKQDRTVFGALPVGLSIIGSFKLILAILLLLIGIGVFRLRNSDLELWVLQLVERFSVDQGSHVVQSLLESVGGISHRKLLAIDALTFAYSGLYFAQGIGLLMRKAWAEYLVVVVTSLLVPYEIYEVLFAFGPVKLLVLVVNLAIVIYLLRLLKQQKRRKTA